MVPVLVTLMRDRSFFFWILVTHPYLAKNVTSFGNTALAKGRSLGMRDTRRPETDLGVETLRLKKINSIKYVGM